MASEEYKESEISKIVKRLMDEEGFEFGEAVREAMEQTKKFESKADGGSIGIEVLFTDKMKNGGRVPMVSGGALKAIGSGIMKMFSKGDDAVDLAKQEEIFRSGNITTDFLENVDDKVIKKFITTRDTKGPGGYGMYDSFAEMPNGLKAAELISRIKTADGGINYEAAELFIGKKLKGDETVNELISMVITEKKADGGRVGLFMGGDPLTGQALNIYNSMNSYGFSDQEIANALEGQGLYTAPGFGTPDTTPGQTIGFQGGNDGPIGGAPSSLVSDFKTQTQKRQDRLTNPNKLQSFINNFTGTGQADIGEMIRTGQVDTRKTSGIPLGIGAAFAKMLPDKYYDMSLGDQVFTQSQMGYTGPTVFGENTSGLNKDPFGLNTRSAFGNYAEAVGKDFAKLSESLSTTGAIGSKKDFQGATFNEETGEFESDTLDQQTLDALNKRTNMVRTKFNFRRNQLGVKNKLDAQIKAAEAERQKQIELQKKIEAEVAAGKSLSQIGKENFTGEGMAFQAGNTGKSSFTGGKTVSSPSTPGGKYGSPKKDGGIIGYQNGGLATMFTRRR